jgi:RNA polymerase sigma-70 factor (ECF subfamily)
MIGKRRALSHGSGGTNTMQVRQPQNEDEQVPAVQLNMLDSRGFEDVVSRYLPVLYRRAYRYVGDPHDAEDAVQDALLSAYKHLDQFKATAKLTTWLTTIVTNSALTQLRRRPRNAHISLDEQLGPEQEYSLSDTLADVRPNAEDQLATSESRGFLMRFVSELSPSLQQSVRLRYLDGLSINEAARILEISVSTMKSRLWRARTLLKQMMREV